VGTSLGAGLGATVGACVGLGEGLATEGLCVGLCVGTGEYVGAMVPSSTHWIFLRFVSANSVMNPTEPLWYDLSVAETLYVTSLVVK